MVVLAKHSATRWLLGIVTGAFFLLVVNLFVFTVPSTSANLQTYTDWCDNNAGALEEIDVTSTICYGLAQLYYDTNGPSWTSNAWWFTTTDLGSWQGLGFFNGTSFSQINLANNNLSGAITDLSWLAVTNLYLEQNNITAIDLAWSYISNGLVLNLNPINSIDLTQLYSGIVDIYLDNTNITFVDLRGMYNLGYVALWNMDLTWIITDSYVNYPNIYALYILNNNLCEDQLDATTIAFLDNYPTNVNWREGQVCLPPVWSSGNPYLIATCQEWKDMNNDLDAYYQLTTDLDCTVDGNTVMIGSNGGPFQGNLNGSGYIIQIDLDDASNYIGLFKATSGATIANFGVSGSVVGDNYVWWLIWYAFSTSVTDTYTTGAVSSNGLYLWWLIGWANNSTIVRAFSYSSITAGSSSDAWWLIGYMQGGTIDASYAMGDVSSIWYNVWWLIWSANNALVSNSYAEGDAISTNYNVGWLIWYVTNETAISLSYAIGNASGANSVWWLVGGGSSTTISQSYAMGDVAASAYAGGLVWYASYLTVLYCYAMGDTYAWNTAGSLFGVTSNGSVEESYSAWWSSGNFNIGGIVWLNNWLETTFTNVFGDNTNWSLFYDEDGGTGLTTEEMKNILTFDNAWWGIELNDDAVYNNGYPILGRQVEPTQITWYINTYGFTWSEETVDWWSAESSDPRTSTDYTFTFTTHADLNNPHAWIRFPEWFEYVWWYLYNGDISISIDTINWWTPFFPGDIGTWPYPMVRDFDIFLGEDRQNPVSISSWSVITITINNVTNPDKGLYPWPHFLYFWEGYEPNDYFVDLSDIQIGADPFDRCNTNSGSLNIPYQECIGLAHLYTETNGNDWYENDWWFDETDVSDWETNDCYYPVDEIEDVLGFNRCDDSNWFDGDGFNRAVVLTGEWPIKNVYAINLSYNNLDGAILSGLAYFPELRVVDIQDNEWDEWDGGLTAVNLSQNSLLEIVDISDNDDGDVRTIDLSNSPLLWSLNIDDLYLETIDLSNNTGLIYIDIDGNELTGFATSWLNLLEYLDISSNNIEYFVSYAPALIELDGSSNDMATVNLTNSPSLKILDLEDNYLESISLSVLSALEELYLDENNFEEIDLSNNTGLIYLDVDYNDISSLDVSSLIQLEELSAESNNLSTLDLSNNLNLEYIYLSSNLLSSLLFAPYDQYTSMSEVSVHYNWLCDVSENTTNFLDEYAYYWSDSWKDTQFFCPIRNLDAESSDGAITLTWNSPRQTAADNSNSTNVMAYVVGWNPWEWSDMIEISEPYWENTTHSWTYEIQGLTNGTVYTIAVCAIHSNEGPSRTVCSTITGTPWQQQNQSCQWWCVTGWAQIDYCPNGDNSGSYYDGKCDGNNPQTKPTPIKLPKLKINQIEKKKPIEFCKYNDTKWVSAAFTDVVWTPYASAVWVLVSHCLVQGYNNNGQDFGINDPLKRGELYKVFTRMALLDFDLNHPWLWWSHGYKIAGETVWLWNLLSMTKDQSALVTQQELLQVTMNYLAYMGVLDEAPEFVFGAKEVTRWEFAKFINTVLGLVSTK